MTNIESSLKLDLLAVAPHPDDAELSVGGILAASVAKGHRVGVLDLTAGELGTQGTVELRKSEAAAATKALGLEYRGNLGLPDGRIAHNGDSAEGLPQLQKLVAKFRELSPRVLLLPYWRERHPDHVAASELATMAVFYAGLAKFHDGTNGSLTGGSKGNTSVFRPTAVFYYQLRELFRPSFIVDISSVVKQKEEAISCFASQVVKEKNAPKDVISGATLLTSELAQSSRKARDQFYGAMIGVSAGEPLLSKGAIGISDPIAHFGANPMTNALFFPEET